MMQTQLGTLKSNAFWGKGTVTHTSLNFGHLVAKIYKEVAVFCDVVRDEGIEPSS